MQSQGKIQKWGNSSAIRLPAKVLAAAGISKESAVDIQADNGRVVIQLPDRTKEQLFDKLLAEVPDAEQVLEMVSQSLKSAISITDKTTKNVTDLCERLEQK
ncbi:MAG: AbrB/MazE/SpoVT family DNA-binding domain-containing protein [Gammaproteobacteria bacterium]|nr:AbrB/MazE/SpoVT family DNA-binding domain-containing protein [Gammaproteobacteria bacterium]